MYAGQSAACPLCTIADNYSSPRDGYVIGIQTYQHLCLVSCVLKALLVVQLMLVYEYMAGGDLGNAIARDLSSPPRFGHCQPQAVSCSPPPSQPLVQSERVLISASCATVL